MTSIDASFPNTRWTLARRAENGDRQAWNELCRAYHQPLFRHAKRDRRLSAESAEECVQDLFARLASDEGTFQPSEDQGRLRSYLIGALNHVVSNRVRNERAVRRGGGAEHLPLEEAIAVKGDDAGSDDSLFDREWACCVVDRAVERLRLEYDNTPNRRHRFQTLKACLPPGEPRPGEIAKSLGISPDNVRGAIADFLAVFARCLRQEVATTLSHESSPAEVDDEIRYLLTICRRAGVPA